MTGAKGPAEPGLVDFASNPDSPMTNKIELSRESILNGHMLEFARTQPDQVRLMSDEERKSSLEATLSEGPPFDRVWVFGYGSLIWNPAFHFEERRAAKIHGYHRQFCLWTWLGRGRPEHPGLMLGLESGGSCRGVAYRLHPDHVYTELDIIWRREMLTSAYRPVWVNLHSGGATERAITFVINRRHERYAGKVDQATMVHHIATASGPIGRCCDYLFETVKHLDELSLNDPRMETLAAAVRAAQSDGR